MGPDVLFRRDGSAKAQVAPAPPPDQRLRDEPDPDVLVEEMVQRLRSQLRSLDAVDEYGRPVSWRNVVRIAVGPALARLRDADTAAGVQDAVPPSFERAVRPGPSERRVDADSREPGPHSPQPHEFDVADEAPSERPKHDDEGPSSSAVGWPPQ